MLLKRYFRALGALSLALSLSALSPVSQAADLKIGVVNVAKILEHAPQAEQARTRLEQEFAPRDNALLKNQQELRDLEEKLARDSQIMSEAERRKIERDVMARQRDVKRAQEEFRDDLNIRRNEEFGKLQRQVYDAIVALAGQEKYDIIFGEGVIYAGSKVDLTDQLLERLRQAYEKPAGKAPSGDKR